ncbi:glycosyltransferase [Halosimplex carlsbadense 2-9-1]|uniref:Glycosyltransferase n=1 Tax=Halosimplex carlsbadense 2-9-1 TaxID=797114 RepID=M0CQK8_9EURY|nr:hypothetical protein [Halosimplex carlsbadense]ELZ24928.1 glycosyltransferase [Halosimplex carlsbadense 2-9-1]
MPFGPRLDRPSAVGDEGRPRETSLGIAAATVVGLALATGFVVGQPTFLTGLGLVAGLATAGVALLDRDALGEKVVGHLLFLPGATLLGLLVALTPGNPFLVGGYALALLGTAAAWADIGDDDTLESALSQGILSYVFGLVWLFGAGIALGAGFLGWRLVDSTVATEDPTVAAVGFLLVLGAVLGAVRLSLEGLPVVQLTPRPRRDAVRARLERGERALSLLAAVAVSVGLVSLIFTTTDSPAVALVPGATPVVRRLASAPVVGPLLAVGGLALLSAGVAVAGRQVTQRYGERRTKTVAAGVAGGGYLVVLLLGVLPAAAGFLVFSPLPVFGGVLLAPLALLVAVGAALVAVRIGLFPDRAGGPALAAAGLVLAAVGADSMGLAAPLVFATVAGALVVWDAGSFGLGLAAELGHRPETRRLELYHGVFAVGIGAVAVLGATALYAVRTSAGTGGHTLAMTAAVVGTLVLGALLRG